MKFNIEYSSNIGQQILIYLLEECSFYMEYTGEKIDMELLVNKIALQVSQDKVVDLSGFCGLDKSMKSNYKVPEYKKGILKVEHNLKYGFAYGINDDDNYEYPVHVNVQTGWVCIGNPEQEGNAVEFINNCVAVIDKNHNFISLWLKPLVLPDI